MQSPMGTENRPFVATNSYHMELQPPCSYCAYQPINDSSTAMTLYQSAGVPLGQVISGSNNSCFNYDYNINESHDIFYIHCFLFIKAIQMSCSSPGRGGGGYSRNMVNRGARL